MYGNSFSTTPSQTSVLICKSHFTIMKLLFHSNIKIYQKHFSTQNDNN